MHDDITIRVARQDDLDEALQVFRLAFEPLRTTYRPTGKAAARQASRANEGTRLVAQYRDRLVGTVQFDSHSDHLHLIGLAVHPEFHRRGVARMLIGWVIEKARAVGQPKVVLETIEETGNVAIFKQLGFRVVQRVVAEWCVSDTFPEVHDVRMELTVADA